MIFWSHALSPRYMWKSNGPMACCLYDTQRSIKETHFSLWSCSDISVPMSTKTKKQNWRKKSRTLYSIPFYPLHFLFLFEKYRMGIPVARWLDEGPLTFPCDPDRIREDLHPGTPRLDFGDWRTKSSSWSTFLARSQPSCLAREYMVWMFKVQVLTHPRTTLSAVRNKSRMHINHHKSASFLLSSNSASRKKNMTVLISCSAWRGAWRIRRFCYLWRGVPPVWMVQYVLSKCMICISHMR